LDLVVQPQIAMLAGGVVIAGLALLRRGLGGYRTADRIADTSTSTISSMAVGEVRISGTVEAAEVMLISALQSVRCVYYHSTIDQGSDDLSDADFVEERSIGFRVRDASGSVRVFPRGARFDAPRRFDAGSDPLGGDPSDLKLRTGSAIDVAELDRDAQIALLLKIPPTDDFTRPRPMSRPRTDRGRRRFHESRLEPGDTVTIIGRALPFHDLPDAVSANLGSGPDLPESDPEIAADLAEAREAGTLMETPAEAWGNAAIAGFGIGRPVSEPTLDADADPLPLAEPEDAARFEQRFMIEPDDLVLVASDEVPLLIAHGTPVAAVDRHREQYLLGLLGASLAIMGAMVFAIMLTGGFGT
jgi:hypothetical protein